MRLVSWFILAALCCATGCTTASEPYPVKLRRSRVIAPQAVGMDVKESTRAALVGFNVVLYSEIPRSQNGAVTPANGLLTSAEVNQLSEQLLATFMSRMATVPGLAWQPLAEVLASSAYRQLPFPVPKLAESLALVHEPLVITAPAGLKIIQAPDSESDRWLNQGIDKFTHRFGNFFKSFQKQMSQLAGDLKVDIVWIVTTHVRLVPAATSESGWRAEITLVELTAVGRHLPSDFSYAFWIAGPLTALPGAPLPPPPPPALTALLARPDTASASTANNTVWPQIGAPYDVIADRFRRSLLRLRGLE